MGNKPDVTTMTQREFIETQPYAKELYTRWVSLKGRCYSPTHSNYISYGAKGIGLTKEWKSSFKCFYQWAINNGYKKELCITRMDNKKDYGPDNCEWKPLNQVNRKKTRDRSTKKGNKKTTLGISSLVESEQPIVSSAKPNQQITMYQGKTVTIQQLAKTTGLSEFTLIDRYAKGLRGEELVQTRRPRIAQ